MIATGRISEVRKLVNEARSQGQRVGFVPTMGALHDGHRSLLRRARTETDYVVASIFVNPAQFGPGEDLDAYPRPYADDLDACAAEGVDLVFHPDAKEMYPQPPATRIVVEDLSEPMEGLFRPGHFEGVALVCAKLFNIVGPCTAYLGEKDAQQLRVVARMVVDLSLPVDVVPCATVRDADGLALSSRNAYLDANERTKALALHGALETIKRSVRSGERDVGALLAGGRRVLEEADVDAVDYLEIVDPDGLRPLDVVDAAALVCGAVRIGKTRLIDNVVVSTEDR